MAGKPLRSAGLTIGRKISPAFLYRISNVEQGMMKDERERTSRLRYSEQGAGKWFDVPCYSNRNASIMLSGGTWSGLGIRGWGLGKKGTPTPRIPNPQPRAPKPHFSESVATLQGDYESTKGRKRETDERIQTPRPFGQPVGTTLLVSFFRVFVVSEEPLSQRALVLMLHSHFSRVIAVSPATGVCTLSLFDIPLWMVVSSPNTEVLS